MMMYVEDYCNHKDVMLKDVDREFCENFVYYLCETKSFIRNTFRDDIAHCLDIRIFAQHRFMPR